MLAEFGIEAEVDEFFQSLTYRFQQQRTELHVTYGEHAGERSIQVSMTVGHERLFYLDLSQVVSIRIVTERGSRWLQISFEADRKLPDMRIHVEPTLRCDWS